MFVIVTFPIKKLSLVLLLLVPVKVYVPSPLLVHVTPFCVTVDYDTILETKEDGSKNDLYNTVTVRFRDSMKQERVSLDDLVFFIQKAIKNYKPVVRTDR